PRPGQPPCRVRRPRVEPASVPPNQVPRSKPVQPTPTRLVRRKERRRQLHARNETQPREGPQYFKVPLLHQPQNRPHRPSPRFSFLFFSSFQKQPHPTTRPP